MHHLRLLCACAALLALGVLAGSQAALAGDAEIVMLQGKGDRSEVAGEAPGNWVMANQGDKVPGGFWVRTQANSQMGLMVPERNQMRLNQNTVMQLKTAEESAEFQQARVKLAKGRAWSQARPRGEAAPDAPPAVAMETPSATLSIRGTDWEVEVADDGTTQVVVLTGEVDVGNEQGQVLVGMGEAALVEVGKAPVKLQLVNPASRVQWVSAWEPQPARWIGAEGSLYAADVARIEGGDYEAMRAALGARAPHEAGAAVLAADLEVQAGNLEHAAELLQPHAANGSGDARASALLARTLVRLDKLDDSERLLDSALNAHPNDAELLIARGELAILRGEPERAESSFRAALDAAATQPLPQAATGAKSPLPPTGPGSSQRSARADLRAEAWYGLGLVAAEREYVRQARGYLDEALSADPEHGKAAAERAAVETFANNLDAAGTRYDALLAKEGDNYEALTGRGINRLKQGDADAALDDFLKAGMIEPRYARSWLYQGVAFYQQGDRKRAAQAFAKAEELDARDPIPHMMASQTHADRLDFGAAIEDARAAQEKMPYLRSLNQLANDQKGSANLGSPIASFGLEEWAKFYADEAYSPYWGGSHLFLADRYAYPFTKSSELLQGFLADPLAFGASIRDGSLVNRPGNYARVDTTYLREKFFEDLIGRATFSGQVDALGSIAYFAQGSYDTYDARKDDTDGDQTDLVGGLGWKPRYDLGLFAFVVDRDGDTDVRDPLDSPTDTEALPDQDQKIPEHRGDIGLSFKPAPDNQVWLKAGGGDQKIEQSGELYSQRAADDIESVVPRYLHFSAVPEGELKRFDVRVYSSDLQFRQSFDLADSTVAWGLERSRQEQRFDLVSEHDATARDLGDTVAKEVDTEDVEVDDEQLYLSAVVPLTPAVTVQVDVYAQDSKGKHDLDQNLFIFGGVFRNATSHGRDSSLNLNPRVGLRIDLADNQQLRIVGQTWRRPAALGTLSGVDTLGIALDDRLTAIGGKLERLRVQYDGEFDGRLFVEAYADREVIDNGVTAQRSGTFSAAADGLAKLRVREEFFTAAEQIEEAPRFGDGAVSSLGLAGNYLLSERTSLSARYVYRYADNDSDDPRLHYDGDIPYVPDHYFEGGMQWSLPWRLQLRADAVFRSRRAQNDFFLPDAESGWAFRLKGYWETADKHHTVQLVLDNLFLDQDAMIRERSDQYLNLQYSYRM